MVELFVQKMIARDGEREIVPSSTEEMHRFIVEGLRPEFDDPRVICVKFLQSCCEDDEEKEETPWYINPRMCRDENGNSNMFDTIYGYGPKMDPTFIPELLLLNFPNTHIVLEKFDRFNTRLMIAGESNLSDQEKYERFVKKYNYFN